MNIATQLERFREPGMTPEKAMREIMPDLMPSLDIGKLNNRNYVNHFMHLLGELRQDGEGWRELVDSMPERIAWTVSWAALEQPTPGQNEIGSDYMMWFVLQTLQLFTTDRDIPFLILNRLVNVPLYELEMAELKQLREHLESAMEMEVMEVSKKSPGMRGQSSVGGESSGGSSSSAQAFGSVTKSAPAAVRFMAPRNVQINGNPFLIKATRTTNAILGRPREQHRNRPWGNM